MWAIAYMDLVDGLLLPSAVLRDADVLDCRIPVVVRLLVAAPDSNVLPIIAVAKVTGILLEVESVHYHTPAMIAPTPRVRLSSTEPSGITATS